VIKTNPCPHYDIGYDNLKTEIISFDNNSTKDTNEENISIQIDVDVPDGQLSTKKTLDNHHIEAENQNASITFKKSDTKCLYISSTSRQKFYCKRKQTNIHKTSKKDGIKYNLNTNYDKYLVHKVYNDNDGVLSHLIYKMDSDATNDCLRNMNIKHLKLFKLLNYLYINQLYVYLHKQSIIIDNLNKNIHINDNIHSKYKIIKHILLNITHIEEAIEIYLKLSADLYNILSLKATDITFGNNCWQRLEQFVDILCNMMDGNGNGFDTVWWIIKTGWTFFRKSPNGKWTKESIVNCKIIAKEEDIVIVYNIADDKNVPINVTMKFKQVLMDLILKNMKNLHQ
jgi:hypothetical protein